MHNPDYEQLATLIRDRIRQLEVSLQSGTNLQEQLAEQQKDADSRIEILTQAPVDEAIQAGLSRELDQLQRNLKWLDEEHAGECETCGCIIPLQRLLTLPTTRLCVDCASQRENND